MVGTDPNLAHSSRWSICAGETPDAYTWHHTEEQGQMELVEGEEHQKSRHLGGCTEIRLCQRGQPTQTASGVRFEKKRGHRSNR
ncbi:HNH endonuclease [Paenibacillus stellifer]|uniref:HNH endonuclease n=1 Tax=Paenibacillus stellifer TaxID=169760 RepID=UPI0014705C73